MISTSGIRAGAAYVELFVKDNRLVRGLDAAAKRIKALGGYIRNIGLGLTGLSAAALAPLSATIFKFAEAGDKLDKMSIRTGISAENLSQLGFAAEQSGSNIDTLGRALKDMKKNIGEGKLGDFFGGKSEFERFMMLADVVSSIEDPAERAAAAMKIFAESGNELLPMLAVGSKGIKSLMDQADKTGLTVSTEDATKAAQFSDAWNKVKRSLEAVVITIGASLAPEVTKLLDKLTPIGRRVLDWINSNRQLIVNVAAIIVGLGAAGIALTAFGFALKALGIITGTATLAFTLLSTIIKLVVLPFTLLSAVIAGVSKAIAFLSITINLFSIATTVLSGVLTATVSLWGILTAAVTAFGAVLTFVLSPLGLITVALGAVAVGFVALFMDFDEWGRAATKTGGEISRGFKGLVKDFGEMFKGVKLAIESKQWENAWSLVILYMKKAWAEFWDWIDKKANDQLRIAMNKTTKYGTKTVSKILSHIGALFTDTPQPELERIMLEDGKIEELNRNERFKHTKDPAIKDFEDQIADLQEKIRIGNEDYKKQKQEEEKNNNGDQEQDALQKQIMNLPKLGEVAHAMKEVREAITARGTFQSQMIAQALGYDGKVSPEEKKLDELNQKVFDIKQIIEKQLGVQ